MSKGRQRAMARHPRAVSGARQQPYRYKDHTVRRERRVWWFDKPWVCRYLGHHPVLLRYGFGDVYVGCLRCRMPTPRQVAA